MSLRYRGSLLSGVLATAMACTAASALTLDEVAVNGIAVYRYTWTDSKGLKRSVSFKKEGSGNAGHGGYIVQMTFQSVSANGTTSTIVANAPGGIEGFGYFVSHERYRTFTDGKSDSIASKIFKRDDSPLGRAFPVSTTLSPTTTTRGGITFKLNYSHYGTIAAGGYDDETGEDKPRLGTSASLYKNYILPVEITWSIQDGRDYPRVVNRVDLANVPGPDRVSFDLRGPYGKIDFDAGDNPIKYVFWGDRYRFSSPSTPLTRNRSWVWSQKNSGARYTSLVAGENEMGLVEPVLFTRSATNDGYAEARGKTVGTYNNGRGCTDPDDIQRIPCDYEWPYQSAQYELPYDDHNAPTDSEKIAWGSVALYGMSLTATYDGTTSVPFHGFPSSKTLTYQVCLVFGRTQTNGLTRAVADAGGTYSCATAVTPP